MSLLDKLREAAPDLSPDKVPTQEELASIVGALIHLADKDRDDYASDESNAETNVEPNATENREGATATTTPENPNGGDGS